MLLAKVRQRRSAIGAEDWDTLRGNAALQQGRWTSGGTKAALGKVMEKEKAKVMKKEKAKVGGGASQKERETLGKAEVARGIRAHAGHAAR